MIFDTKEKVFSDKIIIKILLILVILLAYVAGFYHAALGTERKRYLRLEDMYVRVRGELGRDVTQELIDLSREKELNQ